MTGYAIELKTPWWSRLWRWATRQPQQRLVCGIDYSVGEDSTTEVVVRDNGDGTRTVMSVRQVQRSNR